MSRPVLVEKLRVHIWLYKDDVEFIREMYGETPGFSRAVQLMVNSSLKQIKEKAAAKGAKPIKLQGDELELAEG